MMASIHRDNLKYVTWPHIVPLHCISKVHEITDNFFLHSKTLILEPAITDDCVMFKETELLK